MVVNKRLYKIYYGIKTRCYNKSSVVYPSYGGRGIVMDEVWQNSSDAFIEWSESHGYSDDLQIDRIDNNGNYSPDNCRWVTAKVNSNNRRSSRLITAWGETKTLAEWCDDDRCVVKHTTLLSRLDKQGVAPERAMSIRYLNRYDDQLRRKIVDKYKEGYSYTEIASKLGLDRDTVTRTIKTML